MTKRQRLVISGPTGAGKTTIASQLANRLNLPILSEDMGDIYMAQERYSAARSQNPANRQEIRETYLDWANSFVCWTQRRWKSYQSLDSFVADRWEADLLSLWLRQFPHTRADNTTRQMFQRMRSIANDRIDAVIFLPALRADIDELNSEGLERNPSYGARLMSIILTEGLIRQCAGAHRIYVPDQPMTREERADYVIRQVELLG